MISLGHAKNAAVFSWILVWFARNPVGFTRISGVLAKFLVVFTRIPFEFTSIIRFTINPV